MAAGRFVEVTDKEISEIKKQKTCDLWQKKQNTKTIIRLKYCLGSIKFIHMIVIINRLFRAFRL
jgi:hypothetical protein